MSVIEIVFAILLIVACVFIIAVVLMQESKQGMSNVISGGSSDNYFQKNSGRTKEAKLSRITKIAAILVFVAAIVVNLITINAGTGSSSEDASIGTSGDISFDTDADTAETTEASETTAETTAASETTSEASETTTSAETSAAAQ